MQKKNIVENNNKAMWQTWSDKVTYTPFGDVVVVVHDVSGQSKVADLHYLALR